VPAQNGSTVTTQCQPTNGAKTLAKACGSDSECAAGLFCVFNKCSPVCCPDTQEPCGDGVCNVKQTLDSQGTFMQTCSYADQCVLLTANACPPGDGCYIQGDGFAACVQTSPTPVSEGGSCGFLNDCQDMFICIEDPGVCRALCRPSNWSGQPVGLGGCPQGRKCQGLNAGFPDLGVCVP
jgi:hypothetical protein